MSDAKVGTNIEDAIKNSDWSSVSIALWPHIVEQMKLHSKNIFECEMVYDLAHINTVPALYDDNNGTRKQVIIPMNLFTKEANAAVEETKKATTAANTAAATANTAASNADKAREGLETKKQQVDDAVAASKTATEAAKKATTDTLASKKSIEQNEESRKTAEQTRATSEAARAKAEQGRVEAEQGRESAEHLRETNTSTAIEQSKTQTDLAKELNNHPPKMGGNGNWWLWNLQTHAYEDTGVIARGGAMYPTFRQSRNKLLMIDYGSNISEHVVKLRNKLVIKV